MLHVCQQLASIVQQVERNLLLLVTSASDFWCIQRNSVLFSSLRHSRLCGKQDSLIGGGLCHKQTCTITVIHCANDHQLLIAHCSSHQSIDSQIFVKNRDFRLPHLHSTPPLRGFSSEYCHKVWYGKTRMVWLLNGEKSLRIRLLVLTESINVTDRQTDGCIKA